MVPNQLLMADHKHTEKTIKLIYLTGIDVTKINGSNIKINQLKSKIRSYQGLDVKVLWSQNSEFKNKNTTNMASWGKQRSFNETILMLVY